MKEKKRPLVIKRTDQLRTEDIRAWRELFQQYHEKNKDITIADSGCYHLASFLLELETLRNTYETKQDI